MRLADFMTANTEPILSEWVTFARSCGPAAELMDLDALRDHAREMLGTIIRDLRTPQTDREQEKKSKGLAPSDEGAPDTAAEVHGAGRAGSGFTVGEMVSEYRALRASVIRLWTEAQGTLTGDELQDLMRFNEAIDQSLAESLTRYTRDLDQSKEMFLAILGHDLRNPLNTVIMASQHMLETEELVEPNRTLATRMLRSARRMNTMVGDLLDFTRSRLGPGVPVVRSPMDLEKEAKNAVDELAGTHPASDITLETHGALRGEWDASRMGQVLANLLGNAVQHGTTKSPITVTLTGREDDVVLTVHNRSPVIRPSELPGIFSPFKRLQTTEGAATGSLGLGLYIAERIVTAHGGTIKAASSDAVGTTFTVTLPRHLPDPVRLIDSTDAASRAL